MPKKMKGSNRISPIKTFKVWEIVGDQAKEKLNQKVKGNTK